MSPAQKSDRTPAEAPHDIVLPQPLSPASEAALLAGLTAYTDRQTELFGA